jgi:anion-transporting  ArsA/GET3 family ATPase
VSLLWLEELIKFRKMILDKKQIVTRIMDRKKGKEVENDPILNRIESLMRIYKELANLFTDKEQTKIVIVMNPDTLSLSESRDIHSRLKDLNMTVSHLILNKYKKENDISKIVENEFQESIIILSEKQKFEIVGLECMDQINLVPVL